MYFKQVGEKAKFIELAGEINTAMPEKVIETLSNSLKDRFNKSLDGSIILLVGLAYKKNVDDTRESPAFILIELLEAQGATVDYFDPYVPKIPKTTNSPGSISLSLEIGPTGKKLRILFQLGSFSRILSVKSSKLGGYFDLKILTSPLIE